MADTRFPRRFRLLPDTSGVPAAAHFCRSAGLVKGSPPGLPRSGASAPLTRPSTGTSSRRAGTPTRYEAALLRRGRPLGLANAPSSRERSCRIGCTRTTRSSTDSCTDPATMATSMLARAHARPARYALPAKQIVPSPSALRVTAEPVGGVPHSPLHLHPRPPRGEPVTLVVPEPLHVGGDQRLVEDLHQPTGDDHLDHLPGEGPAHLVGVLGHPDPPG